MYRNLAEGTKCAYLATPRAEEEVSERPVESQAMAVSDTCVSVGLDT